MGARGCLGFFFKLLGLDDRLAGSVDLEVREQPSRTRYEEMKEGYARKHAQELASKQAPCPSCRDQMRGFEVCGIELMDCEHCGGLWLDEGRLDRLCGLENVPEEVLNPPVTWPRTRLLEGRRKCPRCRDLLAVQDFESVRVEVCAYCKGTWLDRGEFHKVLALRKKQLELETAPRPACTFCGLENDRGARSCVSCGAPLQRDSQAKA
ncbi:MAG: zf-TFIIB domain-containing protein [Armatimonadetes bacterium]|nr:zf-TFIIB domain-containing protein [Armatimonadota bacterium]